MPQACNFIKKEALAQMFSCEFREISKNTFFTEHLWTAASTRQNNSSEKEIIYAKTKNLFVRCFCTMKYTCMGNNPEAVRFKEILILYKYS